MRCPLHKRSQSFPIISDEVEVAPSSDEQRKTCNEFNDTIPNKTVREWTRAGIFLLGMGILSALSANSADCAGEFIGILAFLIVVSIAFPKIQARKWNEKKLDDQGQENYVRLFIISLTLPICFLLMIILVAFRLCMEPSHLNLLTIFVISGVAFIILILTNVNARQGNEKYGALRSALKKLFPTPKVAKGFHAWFITALSTIATAIGVNTQAGLVPPDTADIFGCLAFTVGALTLHLARTYRGKEIFSRATKQSEVKPFGIGLQLLFGGAAFTIVAGPFALTLVTSLMTNWKHPYSIPAMIMVILVITALQAWSVSQAGAVIVGKTDTLPKEKVESNSVKNP